MDSRFIEVGGIRTHYLEGGQIEAPVVFLLHSGEYGASAELSWEHVLPALATRFHVIAPDWLGFGCTDKLYDFAAPRERSFGHMRDFVKLMLAKRCADSADFVGSSMGATNLLRMAAARPCELPVRSIVVASGGGFVPMTDARRTLLSYDKSIDSMRSTLNAMFHDERWSCDDAYVKRRQHYALMPGAWEFASAPRMAAPNRAETVTPFGKRDDIDYEAIDVPTLIIAGAEDRLRERGYEQEVARRIVGSEVHVFESCGHCPNIEQAERFCDLTLAFLSRVHQL
ncbi:alpha/beta fold hydrolase [Variovorax paradoxus]|jgi:pimeloyl-ACP methyl ester carboxylesterase|uniref:alpha/beta fold hydrolase n=1 Tax=Variovorax paradoxus TaxID=34073 RepID=UPI003ECEF00B